MMKFLTSINYIVWLLVSALFFATSEFLSKKYAALTNFNGINIHQFSDLIGTPIDMIMGTSILNDYRVLFDYRNSEITFGDEKLDMKGETIHFSKVSGIPILEVELSTRKVQCLLDSGAKLSYLEANITRHYKSLRDENDFYPGHGHFTIPCFDINTKFGQEDILVGYGNLPGVLSQLLTSIGKDGLLGFDFFKNFKLLLDLKNNLLIYQKSN